MRTELGLAVNGLRHRPLPWLLLCCGVALAIAFPVFAAGLRQESAVAAVTDALGDLPAYERTVLANTYRNLRGESAARLDGTVRAGLADAGVQNVARALVFKPVSISSTVVSLAALDAVDSRVRLTSGRLPSRCEPVRCEVVAIRLPGAATSFTGAARAERELGIVVTGTAELTDLRLLGVGLVGANRPLLLSGAPDRLADLEALQLFGRTLGWYGTLDGEAVAARGVDGYRRSLGDLADQTNLAGDGPLSVIWPADLVAAAQARASAAADRFVVLGAGAGALQLGLCLVVAAWLRRRQLRVGLLLVRRGASASQITAVALLQAVSTVLIGVLAGTAASAAIVALRVAGLGGEGGGDPGGAARAAVTSALPALVALSLVAVLLVTVVTRWPPSATTAARYLTVFALISAALVPFLVLSGEGGPGSVGTATAGTSSYASSYAVVAIVASVVAVGLLTALVWPGLVRLGARSAQLSSAGSARLVARRRPLLPMMTAGFLAASCCLLVFSAGYRETLRQSAEDQAAYRVPLDLTVGPSARVATVVEVVDGARLRAVAPGTVVRPIVSAPVTVFGGSPQAVVAPLTGVDPETLTAMHEFSATTGASISAADLAAELQSGRPAGAAAPTIPAGARRLTLRAEGMNADLTLGLWLGTADGRQFQLRLQGSGPQLSAELPGGGAVYTVEGLEIAESEIRLTRREHAAGEGEVDRQVTAGRLRFSDVSIDARPAAWDWSSWGSGQAELAIRPAVAQVDFRITDARVLLTPGFVPLASRPPIPVAVDPETARRAGESGRLVFSVNGQSVPARIVTVLPRLPAAGRQFLLADRSTVVSVLGQSAPGRAFVGQLWIGVPDGDLAAVRAALESSPAAAASITARRDLVRAIDADPVATRSILLLSVAGGVALGLGMVAAAAGVRADVEESPVDRFALELEGITPAGLRARLLRRGVLVAAVGVPLGVAGGLLLTELGVRLLFAGPSGELVVPPLRPVLAGLPVLYVILGAGAGVLAASLLAAATAFRDEWPPLSDLNLP